MPTDLDKAWADVQDRTSTIDASIIEAEFAVRHATAALRGFRCLKKGSNIPSDIHYPALVELMAEMERVIAL